MRETPQGIEIEEVYEPPVLAEAGGYAEVTQGFGGFLVEGPFVYFDPR